MARPLRRAKRTGRPLRAKWSSATWAFATKRRERVLEHFNLTVQPGQTIALVGETGAGKSTIVNLVCRFYEPTEGCVRIDGADYRTRSQHWLHSALGYVLQTPHLFSGTIADNIRFARPDAPWRTWCARPSCAPRTILLPPCPRAMTRRWARGGGRLSTGQKTAGVLCTRAGGRPAHLCAGRGHFQH